MQDFSVLLSVYRKERPEWMREALESVFRQTARPAEVVLVEDGPLTPELDAVIAEFRQKYTELKSVRLPVNGGLGRALNEGLRHCTHSLVARMDTDDVCKPQRFERQLQVFEQMPETDICSAWIEEFEEDKEHITSRRLLPEWHEDIVKYAKKRCPVNHVAVMFRRDKVLALGGYQGFPEDYLLWVRMIMDGQRFYNIQESLLWVRFSPDVIKRRGGWSYAKDDIRAQINFHKAGFISTIELWRNVTIRSVVRLMPNQLRVMFYKHLLRNEGQKATGNGNKRTKI